MVHLLLGSPLTACKYVRVRTCALAARKSLLTILIAGGISCTTEVVGTTEVVAVAVAVSAAKVKAMLECEERHQQIFAENVILDEIKRGRSVDNGDTSNPFLLF